jgi:hypothetical protein
MFKKNRIMRNKILVETKLERIESLLNNLSFSLNRNERDRAVEEVELLKEHGEGILSIIRTEFQDERY